MGRPNISPHGAAVIKSIRVTPEDLAYLLAIDSNLSRAIRRLVEEKRRNERPSRRNGS